LKYRDLWEGEKAKKGGPKNEGMSDDVIENTRRKNVVFFSETMLMKTNGLQISSNDLNEK